MDTVHFKSIGERTHHIDSTVSQAGERSKDARDLMYDISTPIDARSRKRQTMQKYEASAQKHKFHILLDFQKKRATLG
jgi:hypothetical protein